MTLECQLMAVSFFKIKLIKKKGYENCYSTKLLGMYEVKMICDDRQPFPPCLVISLRLPGFFYCHLHEKNLHEFSVKKIKYEWNGMQFADKVKRCKFIQ